VARLIRKENGSLFQSQRFAKNKRETVAALMQLILKEYGKERSLKRICGQLSLDSKLVMKQTWDLKANFKAKKRLLKTRRKSSKEYLYVFGGKITSDNNLLVTAEETLSKVRKRGGNPISLAAGAFYYACKVKRVRITKKVIGKTFSVSDRTVDINERRIRHLLASITRSNSGFTA
jgi:transcription initiation factor TFIIIB Brf1 subunit/transcription initiation factor TFIIB